MTQPLEPLDPLVAVLRHERNRICETVHRIAAALGLNVVVFCTEHGVLGMPEHG